MLSSFSRLPARLLSLRVLIPLGLILISPLSCSSNTQTPVNPAPSSVTPTTTTPYAIQIIMNDKQIAAFTVSDLSKLAQVRANVAGTDERGPTLLSVLALAGVKDFSEVTIYGFTRGRVASAELTLKKTEVSDNIILALVERGTAKLTGPDLGAQKAIIDVSRLVVR